ncbi:MAG: DUF5703 domain-containing protein [Verrucomicrobia bacterium]|nr:DUF5703 domain-containing protein [Verrucomicrobiota bacterium]
MMSKYTVGILTMTLVLSAATAVPAATAGAGNAKGNPALEAALAPYNVVWDSPSKDAHGSMPLGNGDVGINAWVEENGDLVFYVSKTDAWDENARLCKIGRVRVKFDPPLAVKEDFRQELKLSDGVIQIDSKIQNQPARISLWVDADQPVVRVDAEAVVPVSCRAEVELWRLRERPLQPQEDYGYGDGKSPEAQSYKLTVLPDVVATTTTAPQVVWYHRNTRSLYPVCLEVQNLAALKGKFTDPLLNLTFGASLHGVDLVKDGEKALKSSEPGNVCIHRYWSGGLELTAFMLDRYDFQPDERFARNTLVPLADPIIAFFDQYWPKRDPAGKIIIDPAQSLEALPWTVNPMPEIAGLRFILPRLLALPQNLTTEAQRTRWVRMLGELPPLPVADVGGVKLLRPSGSFKEGNYSENP